MEGLPVWDDLAVFLEARATTLRLLQTLTDRDLDRPMPGGRTVVRRLLQVMLEHDDEHLQQILTARKRARARRTEIDALVAEFAVSTARLTANLSAGIVAGDLDRTREPEWSLREIARHLTAMEHGWLDSLDGVVGPPDSVGKLP